MEKNKSYTDEFKKQIVALYTNGKSANLIAKEYKISKSVIYRWANSNNNSGSFKTKDNRNATENELITLRKEIKQLKMENDILRQATLIVGKKNNRTG